jgi:hypothetical protein
MLHITNLRTVAIGVSSLGLAAAGIAISLGGDSAGSGPASAGATAGHTASAQVDTSRQGALHGARAAVNGASIDAAFEGPAPANRLTDRPTVRAATTTLRTNRPATQQPLLSADVDGPVDVHITTDDVLRTVGSTVTTATNTVAWAKATVDRTVQSLPVKATVTTGRDGTDVSAQALGTSANAHIPR